jgi:hypothetical protein
LPEICGQLVGQNLNQLARWANIGGDAAPSAADVLDTLDALTLAVYQIKLDLLGTEPAE